MKDYETYLFDVDGTLLDTMELIYRSFKKTCFEYGALNLERQVCLSHVGIPLIKQLEIYLGDLGEDQKTILKFHMDYQASIYKEYLKIFPGVKDTLKTLQSRGKKMGIVTSRTGPSLLRYLDYFGLTDFFTILVTPECTENHKPDPDPVLWALEHFKTPPDNTLFLGDAEVDILSGYRAGTDTAFAQWGPNNSESLKVKPNWVLNSIGDLICQTN